MILKGLLYAGVMFVLFIPMLQDYTEYKTYIAPLNGSFETEKDTAFNWPAWWEGSYQEQKNRFLKDNFGLHNYYVRLNSQLNFNLFKKANAAYVVVGKDNYLYETGYIDAYHGKDFIGTQKVETYMRQLKQVQDTLAAHNKLLLVVFAAGKASFYPEYIPDHLRKMPSLSNYHAFRAMAARYNINHIDFNKYFIEQKNKSPYPLYPQYGIHWSNYGSIMAFDSMVKYTEHKLQRDLPDVELPSVELSDSLRHTDNDIIKGMNLLWEPPSFKMAYPTFNVRNDSTKHRPSMLVIADSFWWHIYSTNLPAAVFSNHQFWYYNEAIYPQSFTAPMNVKDTDYKNNIRSFDVIVLLHTESTLARFGDGFVEMCYEALVDDAKRKNEIEHLRHTIRSDVSWYKQVQEKAATKGISADSMLTLDAIYVLDQKKP